MAKIGNEATLILRLAEERMWKKLDFKERNLPIEPTFSYDQDHLKGYQQACKDYRETLVNISLELERK